MNFTVFKLSFLLLLIFFCSIGFSQNTFPNRSFLISGGITSERMLNTDSTQIELPERGFNQAPFTDKYGAAYSVGVAYIWKRKKAGKKGFHLLSLRSDFANLYNDIVTYRDTFLRGGDVYHGEDIFVSRMKYKPHIMRRVELGFGRWYSMALFKSKLNLTYGATWDFGLENRSYYTIFESDEKEEVFVDMFNILSGINLDGMLSYPLGENLNIFVKVTSEFFKFSIDSTKYSIMPNVDSRGLDLDMQLEFDYIHLGLLFTLKEKSDEN